MASKWSSNKTWPQKKNLILFHYLKLVRQWLLRTGILLLAMCFGTQKGCLELQCPCLNNSMARETLTFTLHAKVDRSGLDVFKL